MATKTSIYLYFVSVILLSFIFLTNSGCLKVKELTDNFNMHKDNIVDIKLSEDSKKVYSIDHHTIKVWDLIGNRLILKQQWSDTNFVGGLFYKIFVWNNGKKLFVLRSKDIYIFNYNEIENKYDINKYERVQIYPYIQSIYVNQQGNQMYVGLAAENSRKTLLRYTYDGYKWFDTTPRTFSELTNISSVWTIRLTKDQKRLIIYYLAKTNFQNEQDSIKIFDLTRGQPILVQQIIVKDDEKKRSYMSVSDQDKYITCFGTNMRHSLYVLDSLTNLYVNVSQSNPSTQYYTIDSAMIDQKNNLLTQLASFQGVLQVYTVDVSNRTHPKFIIKQKLQLFTIPGFKTILISDIQSRFYLLVANTMNLQYQYFGRIYLVSCYQLQEDQNLRQEEMEMELELELELE